MVVMVVRNGVLQYSDYGLKKVSSAEAFVRNEDLKIQL